MIRLLLADDHTVVRESLVAALIASGECIVVAEAGDGITAIEQALALRPDVAIIDISMPRLRGIEVVPTKTGIGTDIPATNPAMREITDPFTGETWLAVQAIRPDVAIIDISMPRLSGIEVVRRLKAELPRTRVLVLTMHEEEEYVLHVVRAGAAGYLLKHAATSELLSAVRTLAAGGVHFGPYAAKVLADQLQQPQRTHDDPYGALTSREREVLHLVVDGLTTKEIARRLDISVKTAENHRGRILDKLDVRNSAELVRYAIRKRLVQ